MSCTILDILMYFKNIVMLIGYLMLKTQYPIVVMCSHWEEQQFHGNPKKMIIVISTMESKFIALDKCKEEVEWLRHFL